MLRLGASGAGLSTAAPVPVAIEVGQTARVELVLEPATRVHVRVLDASGAFVGCDLSATDEAGRAVALARGTTGEAWLGPLPGGRYRVSARRDTGRLERAFEVRGGEPELELVLSFE
jgi:hypothetical protein